MEKLNVYELKQEMGRNIGEYGDRMIDYDNGYISDVIQEIADNGVDIYNYALWDWAKDNSEYVEDAIDEFGWDSKNSTLIQLFQMSQYLQIQEELYENLDDIIIYWIYDKIEYEEITLEEKQAIIDYCYRIDNNMELENVLEEINQILKEVEK